MSEGGPNILVLGASGVIGAGLVDGLLAPGWGVVAAARRFTRAQSARFAACGRTVPILDLDADALARALDEAGADIVVNCLGVLQDGPRGRAEAVHQDFVARLLQAIASRPRPILLAHLSVPGDAATDATPFSRTKRNAEHLIAQSGAPFVILRPGFVVAPVAYGGGAMIRALAALPFALPARESARPFASTAMSDLVDTLARLAADWRGGDRSWREVWDVTETNPGSVGDVIAAYRRHFGGPAPELVLPAVLLSLGAKSADVLGWLGWAPPIRSTALAEMRRGVSGDPGSWLRRTGLTPKSLVQALAALTPSVQEAWFARLYLLKGAVAAALAIFWTLSGVIALTSGFGGACGLVTRLGFGDRFAAVFVAATSLLDIGIGVAIACRASHRAGLWLGMGVSLGYLVAISCVAPSLWLDPLGPLVKVLPTLPVYLVALAIFEDR